VAITLLQTKTTSKTLSAGTTSTVAMSTTANASLVVVVGNCDKGATLGGITGIACAGMSFAKIDESVEGGGAIADVSSWYAFNITGNTTPTLTVTYAAGMIGGAIIREYSGIMSASDPLDKHAIAKDAVANNAPNSGATTGLVGSNDLVVGFAGTGDSGNTYTAGAAYGNATTLKIGTTVDMGMEDKILSGTTVAQTAPFTITNISDWVCAIATFQEAPAVVAAASSPTLLMMGV
jgi:hypothetical protein